MPRYEYRCPEGHVTELVLPLADDKPETVRCTESIERGEDGTLPAGSWTCYRRNPEAAPILDHYECGQEATRVFHAPIAVHWSGAGGSYYEDSYRNDSGRYGWKRRKNAADDLPIEVS